MVYTAESVDFDNFMPVDAGYGPREISAEAAYVSEHNIGQWSLEFEKDLGKDDNGKVCFYFSAAREPEPPIHLKMESGVWIIKIWGELHIFEDGMFQKTFDVPKEQLRAVRMANHRKSIELEEQYKKELEEERAEFEKEFDEKLKQAADSGDWSSLTKQEEYVLRMRLADDDEIRALMAAAVERADKKSTEPPLTRVGKDYHAGSLYKSDGADPSIYGGIDEELLEVRVYRATGEQVLMRMGTYDLLSSGAKKMYGPVERLTNLSGSKDLPLFEEKDTATIRREQEERKQAALVEDVEQTQFVPQVSIPLGPPAPGELMKDWKKVEEERIAKEPIYPEGDEPRTNRQKVDRAREQFLSNEEVDRASKAPVTEVWGTDQQ